MKKIIFALLLFVLHQTTWAKDIVEIRADQLPGSYYIENSRNNSKFAFVTLGNQSIVLEFLIEEQSTIKCDGTYKFDNKTMKLTAIFKKCPNDRLVAVTEFKGVDYDAFLAGVSIPFDVTFGKDKMPGEATIRKFQPFAR